ncbi:hypothetical protein H4R19_000258 [Coemansia spiralis]|nr:hypothetical protein H4R19_000258 [Coemansia spiralis]
MDEQAVRVVFRFPFRRPEGFREPAVTDTGPRTVEEQVWRCLLSLPGSDGPQAILAELEQDQVTFDWELLAETLQVPLSAVFEAASSLFAKHMGRPLAMAEESIQLTHQQGTAHAPGQARITASSPSTEVPPAAPASRGSTHRGDSETDEASQSRDSPADSVALGRAGLRSVESLGLTSHDEPQSPAVELSSITPRAGSSSELAEDSASHSRHPMEPQLEHQLHNSGPAVVAADDNGGGVTVAAAAPFDMRQSMLADAMGSRMLPDRRSLEGASATAAAPTTVEPPLDAKKPPPSTSSSFSDLSNSSLTESAMQDALISEAMNASTMSSLLGSRVFPWAKKR